jgi:hypothetical protein
MFVSLLLYAHGREKNCRPPASVPPATKDIDRFADFDDAATEAEIATVVVALTVCVCIPLKFRAVWPAGTVIAGSERLAADEAGADNVTGSPPAGAGSDSVTVPLTGLPPTALVGDTVNAVTFQP